MPVQLTDKYDVINHLEPARSGAQPPAKAARDQPPKKCFDFNALRGIGLSALFGENRLILVGLIYLLILYKACQRYSVRTD